MVRKRHPDRSRVEAQPFAPAVGYHMEGRQHQTIAHEKAGATTDGLFAIDDIDPTDSATRYLIHDDPGKSPTLLIDGESVKAPAPVA